MKKQLLSLATTAFVIGSTQAAVLFSSNFDGNNVADLSTTATVAWATDAAVTMGNSGNLTAVGDTFAVAKGGFSTIDNITTTTNLNINRPDARGYSFSFTTTSDFNLTNLQILSGHVSNVGGDQVYPSDLNWSISGGVGSGTINKDYADAPAYLTTDVNLTGTTLVAGTYTINVDINNMVGGGAYASFDGITLEGTVVPEPSSAALLGLGGLALILRRRK